MICLIGVPVILRNPSLPGNGSLVVSCHAQAFPVHTHQLFHGFGKSGFGGTGDQCQRPFVVGFHIHTAQIGKTDEEIMLRRGIVFQNGKPLHLLQQGGSESLFVVGIRDGRNAGIVLRQCRAIRCHHFRRQNGLPGSLCHGVLRGHDVINFIDQIRSHRQNKQTAFLQSLPNGVVEIFSRSQKFIVPDGNVPAEIVLVYQPHQLLRIAAVLFAVAEEHIGIESGSDLLRQLIPNQHVLQIFAQLFIKGKGGIIPGIGVEVLQVSALFCEYLIKTALLHQRQYRDMVLHRKAELLHSGVFRGQQSGGHGHNEQLNLLQVRPEIRIPLPCRVLQIEHRAGLLLQKQLRHRLQKKALLVRMTAKINPRHPLRTPVSFGNILQNSHCVSSLSVYSCYPYNAAYVILIAAFLPSYTKILHS